MKAQNVIIATFIVLLAIGAVGLALYSTAVNKPAMRSITSFEECVGAGYPVAESYPRQCTADGHTFVEAVANPVVPPITPPAVSTGTSTDLSDKIVVDAPTPGSKVTSPLTVSGRARGTWYFEAVFPVDLVDDAGHVIAHTQGRATSDWMTQDFVPFTGVLEWSSASTTATSGKIIFKRDNPSGLPENDAAVEVPVTL